jgi:mannonate dehydratase
MGIVTIKDVQAFVTAPEKINLVVVKVTTSEEGLYGVGCATFTQRYLAVVTAVEQYLKPFLIGKEVNRIEDIWQTSMVSSYWRNGPVLNNAVSGVDMALWDIKGKMAGMPLYELLGGKCREAAIAYTHADGATVEETIESAQGLKARGFRNIRLQCGGYGGKGHNLHSPKGTLPGAYYDPKAYMRTILTLFEKARTVFGQEIGLLHDIHERLPAIDAAGFAKKMEQFDLVYLEDALPPEQPEWFERIRNASSVPLAMGELFVNSNEWLFLVSHRLIDYIRVHLSMIGGITPTVKLAKLCEAFGVRTAWHGPGDLSPIGAAANIHVDLACPNFGIQEWFNGMTDASLSVFPGAPRMEGGYLYVSDKPGIGVDFNEKEARKFPCDNTLPSWTLTRFPDGGSVRP